MESPQGKNLSPWAARGTSAHRGASVNGKLYAGSAQPPSSNPETRSGTPREAELDGSTEKTPSAARTESQPRLSLRSRALRGEASLRAGRYHEDTSIKSRRKRREEGNQLVGAYFQQVSGRKNSRGYRDQYTVVKASQDNAMPVRARKNANTD